MQFLYKAAASIYCELVVLGNFRLTPPLWLFNKPKRSIPHTYTEVILADHNFNNKERWLIEEAVHNMEWFLNGFIRFEVKFEWDSNQIIPDNQGVILRAAPTDKTITYADGYFKSKILGLCLIQNEKIAIHLVSERLQDQHLFRTTVLHELGHYLGMGHIELPSIMHAYNYNQVLYMTRKDAEEFGKLFNLNPEALQYFKL